MNTCLPHSLGLSQPLALCHPFAWYSSPPHRNLPPFILHFPLHVFNLLLCFGAKCYTDLPRVGRLVHTRFVPIQLATSTESVTESLNHGHDLSRKPHGSGTPQKGYSKGSFSGWVASHIPSTAKPQMALGVVLGYHRVFSRSPLDLFKLS